MVDGDSYAQMQREKQTYLDAINLGKAVKKLENNSDFIELMQYLDNKLKATSIDWAIDDDESQLKYMRFILLFKQELENIKNIANIAKDDLKSLTDLES